MKHIQMQLFIKFPMLNLKWRLEKSVSSIGIWAFDFYSAEQLYCKANGRTFADILTFYEIPEFRNFSRNSRGISRQQIGQVIPYRIDGRRRVVHGGETATTTHHHLHLLLSLLEPQVISREVVSNCLIPYNILLELPLTISFKDPCRGLIHKSYEVAYVY